MYKFALAARIKRIGPNLRIVRLSYGFSLIYFTTLWLLFQIFASCCDKLCLAPPPLALSANSCQRADIFIFICGANLNSLIL